MSMLRRHVSCGSGRCDPFENHSCRYMAREVWLEQLRQGDSTQSSNRKGQVRRPCLPESGRKVMIASTHPEGGLAMEKRVTLGQFYSISGGKTTSIIWEACKQCQPLGPHSRTLGMGPRNLHS